MKIAILDDYQNVALIMADWSALAGRAEITVFNEHLADPGAIVEIDCASVSIGESAFARRP